MVMENYLVFSQSVCPMINLILQNQSHENLHWILIVPRKICHRDRLTAHLFLWHRSRSTSLPAPQLDLAMVLVALFLESWGPRPRAGEWNPPMHRLLVLTPSTGWLQVSRAHLKATCGEQLYQTNLQNITLPIKVHLAKAVVFPVVMHGCESWTIKKAEH